MSVFAPESIDSLALPSIPLNGKDQLPISPGIYFAIEQAETNFEQHKCRCPGCERFGVVSGSDSHYGTIYDCSCIHIHWVIAPETGEKVEGS